MEMLFRVALGQVLRDERKAQGLVMRQVVEQANIALGYLSEVERGQKEIASEFLEDLVTKGLGVSTSEIIMQTALLMAGIEIPDTAQELLDYLDEHAKVAK